MFHYVFKRLAVMIPTLVVISFIIFVIIQLPPGDYLETYIAELESQGESVDREKIEFLRRQYGLDQTVFGYNTPTGSAGFFTATGVILLSTTCRCAQWSATASC